jgi:hypothetical protein
MTTAVTHPSIRMTTAAAVLILVAMAIGTFKNRIHLGPSPLTISERAGMPLTCYPKFKFTNAPLQKQATVTAKRPFNSLVKQATPASETFKFKSSAGSLSCLLLLMTSDDCSISSSIGSWSCLLCLLRNLPGNTKTRPTPCDT